MIISVQYHSEIILSTVSKSGLFDHIDVTHRKRHIYHVYIMTNRYHTVLYTGMTGRGLFRILEHIKQKNPGFTKKYNLNKLVYLERFTEVLDAIAREKQIKKWSRKKKIWLIEKENPNWDDLFVKYTNKNSKY